MSNDREAQVKVTADASEVSPAMDKAAASVTTAADKMRGALATMGEQTAAQMGAMRGQIAGAVAAVGQLGAVAAAVGLGGMLVLGQRLVDQMDEFNDWSDATGASVDSLSALDQVARRTGTTLDTVGSIMMKLQMKLRATDGTDDFALAIKHIGLNVADLKAMDPAGMTHAIARALNQFADDGSKARLVMELTGRSAKEAAPYLKDLGEQSELAGKLTAEQADQAEKLNKQLYQLKADSTDAARAIMSELIPALTSAAAAFRRMKADGGKVFGAEFKAEFAAARFKLASDTLIDLREALEKEPGNEGLKRAIKQQEAEVDALRIKAFAAADALRGLVEVPAPPDAGGGRGFVNPETVRPSVGDPPRKPEKAAKPKAEQEPAYMPYYQLMLDEAQRAYATLNEGRQMSAAEELAWWQQLQADAQMTAKDKVAVMRQTSKLSLEILRQQAKDAAQLDEISAKAAEDKALSVVEMARQQAQDEQAQGLISARQLLQIEEELEQQKGQIRMQALLQRRALIDPERDPVAYAQINAQIEAQESQHQQAMGQIRGQALTESSQRAQQLGGTLASSWATVFSQIGTSIKSVGGFMKAMARSTLMVFVQMAEQMAAKWLVSKLAMKAVNKVSALGQIAEESAKAGAGGVASMAAAPFPLNLGAPAFGAEMAAAAMAFAPAASASGGYDIPSGTNPITQLHQREMVLPAGIADPLRQAISGGTLGQQADAPVVHLHGTSPRGFFIAHADDLAGAVHTAARDGRLSRGY